MNDNAVNALKIAFAVLVFVIAVSISMRVFGQAKTVSDEVFYMTDKTNFYDYTSGDNSPEGRIVSGETIIPTLYRYYKENFVVKIKDANGNTKWEFNLEQEIKDYSKDYRRAPWVGNANIDTKLRVDVEVSGKEQNINNVPYQGKHPGEGIFEYVNGKRFRETFKEIRYSGKEITINDEGEIASVGQDKGEVANPINETLELVKGNTKIEITYQLIDR